MFDFIDLKTSLIIVHLFGVAFGVGGAISSDLMFFKTMRDKHIIPTEMAFLKIGSVMVWTGLALLVASGTAMFSLDPATYLVSTKFLAKMTIVGILIINAGFFHLIHIPRLKRHVGHHFPSSDEFVRWRVPLLISGAVSLISWTAALVLGSLSVVPYSFAIIMSVYLAIVTVGCIIALIFRDTFIPCHTNQK